MCILICFTPKFPISSFDFTNLKYLELLTHTFNFAYLTQTQDLPQKLKKKLT